MVQGVFQQWGEHWLDLFAAAKHANCQHFYVLYFPSGLSLVDSFHLEWSLGLLYAFLPLPPLARVLEKIKTDLVAPDWARRVWYPELLDMSICPPIRLPLREDLLSQQQGRVLHPNLHNLHLRTWRFSSDS